jgi:hypothetical protein
MNESMLEAPALSSLIAFAKQIIATISIAVVKQYLIVAK